MPLPAGSPEHCPLCRQHLVPDPPPLYGDVTCPHCGELLWFVWRGGVPAYYDQFDAIEIQRRVKSMVAATLGIAPDQVPDDFQQLTKSLGADSLDIVEIVMELEEDEF